jgi:hypothetical protein
MLTSQDIRARVRRTPFVPLRIRTSDGASYDVYHQDLIMIGRRALIVERPASIIRLPSSKPPRLQSSTLPRLKISPSRQMLGGNGQGPS